MAQVRDADGNFYTVRVKFITTTHDGRGQPEMHRCNQTPALRGACPAPECEIAGFKLSLLNKTLYLGTHLDMFL